MHLYPRARSLGQRLREFTPDLAFFQKKVLERDRSSRRSNPLQHGGKNLISILQDRDLVAREKRRAQQLPHCADKHIVARRVVRPDGTLDLLLRLKKIPDDED